MKREGVEVERANSRFGKLVRYMYGKATAPPIGREVRLISRVAGSIPAGNMQLGYFTHSQRSPTWP